MIDGVPELVLDLPIAVATERGDGAFAGADEAGDHRQLVADHVVEIERRVGLVDERRDMANVDGLMQIDKVARLPQAIKKLAEILLHRRSPAAAVVGDDGLGYLDAQRPAIQMRFAPYAAK